jgi:hypothetical protein
VFNAVPKVRVAMLLTVTLVAPAAALVESAAYALTTVLTPVTVLLPSLPGWALTKNDKTRKSGASKILTFISAFIAAMNGSGDRTMDIQNVRVRNAFKKTEKSKRVRIKQVLGNYIVDLQNP